mmetsp:Transcript_2424/g.4874  ORF Transcript_2424/g.4874 Transcript_2424/m.4874 type:complete len:294 (+) Transcript_2424:339-1220(+)
MHFTLILTGEIIYPARCLEGDGMGAMSGRSIHTRVAEIREPYYPFRFYCLCTFEILQLAVLLQNKESFLPVFHTPSLLDHETGSCSGGVLHIVCRDFVIYDRARRRSHAGTGAKPCCMSWPIRGFFSGPYRHLLTLTMHVQAPQTLRDVRSLNERFQSAQAILLDQHVNLAHDPGLRVGRHGVPHLLEVRRAVAHEEVGHLFRVPVLAHVHDEPQHAQVAVRQLGVRVVHQDAHRGPGAKRALHEIGERHGEGEQVQLRRPASAHAHCHDGAAAPVRASLQAQDPLLKFRLNI